jgi:hypothetical protein
MDLLDHLQPQDPFLRPLVDPHSQFHLLDLVSLGGFHFLNYKLESAT